ncbi:hypothetical protein EYF80_041238 [Liparis tanakae]|uniref:Uncharacterized protein n=1 Tax=Liparis tanakae TaxID=230148 RepID=A0A4Z2G7J2_9TELE|nr:hypothetical protein EYF80_041238 [Liparis tanakae]
MTGRGDRGDRGGPRGPRVPLESASRPQDSQPSPTLSRDRTDSIREESLCDRETLNASRAPAAPFMDTAPRGPGARRPAGDPPELYTTTHTSITHVADGHPDAHPGEEAAAGRGSITGQRGTSGGYPVCTWFSGAAAGFVQRAAEQQEPHGDEQPAAGRRQVGLFLPVFAVHPSCDPRSRRPSSLSSAPRSALPPVEPASGRATRERGQHCTSGTINLSCNEILADTTSCISSVSSTEISPRGTRAAAPPPQHRLLSTASSAPPSAASSAPPPQHRLLGTASSASSACTASSAPPPRHRLLGTASSAPPPQHRGDMVAVLLPPVGVVTRSRTGNWQTMRKCNSRNP